MLNNAYPQVLDAFSDSRVIVDMPPILGTADAVLIAAMTKAVILVSDIRHGDPDRIGQAIHEFHRAGAKVLGVVLNHVSRLPRIDYYDYSPPPDTGHARSDCQSAVQRLPSSLRGGFSAPARSVDRRDRPGEGGLTSADCGGVPNPGVPNPGALARGTPKRSGPAGRIADWEWD